MILVAKWKGNITSRQIFDLSAIEVMEAKMIDCSYHPTVVQPVPDSRRYSYDLGLQTMNRLTAWVSDGKYGLIWVAVGHQSGWECLEETWAI